MNEATFYKSILTDVHQLAELGCKPVHHYFRYELANWVNEGNWTVIPNRHSLRRLGEQNHQGIIRVVKMSRVKALECFESRH
jgi:hypothetical protein